MARYIRIYDNPKVETRGSIIGFSRGIAAGAYDPELIEWLEGRDYHVTTESEKQRSARLAASAPGIAETKTLFEQAFPGHVFPVTANPIPDFIIRTPAYPSAPGIPLPPNSVSAAHLLLEGPIRDDNLTDLGMCLSSLSSIYDGGLRKHLLIDNRGDTVIKPYDSSKIVASWS